MLAKSPGLPPSGTMRFRDFSDFPNFERHQSVVLRSCKAANDPAHRANKAIDGQRKAKREITPGVAFPSLSGGCFWLRMNLWMNLCLLPRTTVLLHSQRSEILLSALQGLGFCACGPLPIHPEPQDGDYKPCDTSGDILRHLPALLFAKLLDALIVGLNLSQYRCAVEHLILRLNNRDGLWCPPCACG